MKKKRSSLIYRMFRRALRPYRISVYERRLTRVMPTLSHQISSFHGWVESLHDDSNKIGEIRKRIKRLEKHTTEHSNDLVAKMMAIYAQTHLDKLAIHEDIG